MADRRLRVSIIGDSRSLVRAFLQSEDAGKKFSRSIGQAGRGVASGAFRSLGRQVAFASSAFLGGAGAVAAISSAVNAASDLNEEISKTRVVFGASSDEVLRWSRTASEAMKLSRQEALAAAGGFGNMLETAGLVPGTAAKMSSALVQLGADMGSFNNADPSDMLDRLRSGLAGEAEPLRRFGVLLSEARVAQEAVRLGLARNTRHLTEQAKVQARYSLILRDTARQQGDVARTGGQFAGQMRELRARIIDTEAAIGKELLPRINDLVTQFNEWLSEPRNQRRIADDARDAAGAFGTFASTVKDAHDKYSAFVEFYNSHRLHLDTRTVNAARGIVSFLGTGRVRPGPGTLVGAVGGGGNFDPRFTRPDDRARGGRVGDRGGFPTGGGEVADLFRASAAQRNQWFDRLINRRLGRVQDVRTLRGQVAALNEIAGLIQQRLAATKDVTRRATLEDELVNVFRQRAAVRGDIAANQQAATVAARESILARLGFGVDRATATRTLKDDVAALNTLAAELRRQIAAGGDVLALQQQLFGVTQQIAGAREEAAARARQQRADAIARIARANARGQAQTVARQFGALGLGPTGGEVVPSAAALRKRLGTIEASLKGTVLDTSATRRQISRIRSVLSGEFGKLNADVRAKVKDLEDALKPDTAGRRLTNTVGLDTKALVAGLGLSPDQVRELRGRASVFNSAGRALGGAPPPRGSFVGGRGGDRTVIEVPVYLDGWQIAKVTTRQQQKAKSRNPPQRRGPNAGRTP